MVYFTALTMGEINLRDGALTMGFLYNAALYVAASEFLGEGILFLLSSAKNTRGEARGKFTLRKEEKDQEQSQATEGETTSTTVGSGRRFLSLIDSCPSVIASNCL